MEKVKIPLFRPFKDMNQGFEKMLDIAENMETNEDKIQMLICYGCLVETFNIHNRNIREECDDIDTLMRDKISENKGGES